MDIQVPGPNNVVQVHRGVKGGDTERISRDGVKLLNPEVAHGGEGGGRARDGSSPIEHGLVGLVVSEGGREEVGAGDNRPIAPVAKYRPVSRRVSHVQEQVFGVGVGEIYCQGDVEIVRAQGVKGGIPEPGGGHGDRGGLQGGVDAHGMRAVEFNVVYTTLGTGALEEGEEDHEKEKGADEVERAHGCVRPKEKKRSKKRRKEGSEWRKEVLRCLGQEKQKK